MSISILRRRLSQLRKLMYSFGDCYCVYFNFEHRCFSVYSNCGTFSCYFFQCLTSFCTRFGYTYCVFFDIFSTRLCVEIYYNED